MFDIRKIIKSRKLRGKLIYSLSFVPDSLYLRIYYFAMNGHWLHLNNPKGYNEKLQWMKLHDKHPEYTDLVDKIRVRDIVKEKIGPGYMFPLLGYWESFDEIDFSKLPDSFVLKCNHDSGSVKIVHDKNALSKTDIQELRAFYTNRLERNFFYAGREYPYKNVKPYILAEPLMSDAVCSTGGIKDFKFFCFNGEPKLMLLVSGRQTEKHEDYFDMDFNRQFVRNGWTESAVCPEKPDGFEEMKQLAYKLAEGIRHVRLDFYEVNGKIYFGEYTFFSGGGFELFVPSEWEQRLGDWIQL